MQDGALGRELGTQPGLYLLWERRHFQGVREPVLPPPSFLFYREATGRRHLWRIYHVYLLIEYRVQEARQNRAAQQVGADFGHLARVANAYPCGPGSCGLGYQRPQALRERQIGPSTP